MGEIRSRFVRKIREPRVNNTSIIKKIKNIYIIYILKKYEYYFNVFVLNFEINFTHLVFLRMTLFSLLE